MAIGHEDHGGVAVTPAVVLGGRHQLLDLAVGQVRATCIWRWGGAAARLFVYRLLVVPAGEVFSSLVSWVRFNYCSYINLYALFAAMLTGMMTL